MQLEIQLGGPNNYEVDMAALAKATGQQLASPPMAVKLYESESDGDGMRGSRMGTDRGGDKKAKKVRKRVVNVECSSLQPCRAYRKRKRTWERSTAT